MLTVSRMHVYNNVQGPRFKMFPSRVSWNIFWTFRVGDVQNRLVKKYARGLDHVKVHVYDSMPGP